MKKINSMDYLLVFGSIILFCSGIALMCNEFFNTYLIKTMGIVFLGVVLYILSLVFKYILNVEKSFKVAHILGNLSILIAYIMAGCNDLMGSWFSINGEGVQLFLASIAFLVMILSILTTVLVKSYRYINITFIAILVGIFHLLNFFRLDYQISLIIVGGLLLFCNLFKLNKFMYDFSSIAVFVYTILCLIFGLDSNILLSSIILGLNSICLLSVLGKSKSVWMELLVVTSFIILLGVYLASIHSNMGLLIVITTFVVCVFELVANTFKLINNKPINVISKLICFFILIGLFYKAEYFLVSQVVSLTFLLVTTVANAYIIKHEPVEKYLLPFKLCFIVGGVYDLISARMTLPLNEVYLFAIFSLILMGIYQILARKNQQEKIIYLIINIIVVMCMAVSDEKGIIEFTLCNLILLINYLVFRCKDNVALNRVLYTFIVFMFFVLTDYDDLSIFTTIIQIGIFAGLAFVNHKDKYNYIVTSLLLYFTVLDLVDLTIINGALSDIVSSIFFLALVGISSEVLFDNATHKNVFTGILITLELLMLLDNNHVFIVNIYSLIVSLIIILVALKNDNYKALYYIGLIMGSLNLIGLISFLDGLPVAVYLFIIAVILISIVSVMIYKYQHRGLLEEKVVVREHKEVLITNTINYCGECGNKIGTDEKFCGNCGTKVK